MAWDWDSFTSIFSGSKEPLLKTAEGFLSSWLSPVVNWVLNTVKEYSFLSFVTGVAAFFLGRHFWWNKGSREDAETMRELREFKDELPNLKATLREVKEGLDSVKGATIANTGAITTFSSRIHDIGTAVRDGFANIPTNLGLRMDGLKKKVDTLDGHATSLKVVQGHTTTIAAQMAEVHADIKRRAVAPQ